MKRTAPSALVVATAALVWAPAFAGMDHSGHQMMAQAPAAETRLTEGVVKKIDKAAGKVTLAHGPLTNLGMPAMTMAFRVKDSAWLDNMKAGARIRFLAEQVGGVFTVVRYEAEK